MFDFSEAIEKGAEIVEISNSTLAVIVFIALGLGALCSDGFYYGAKYLIKKINKWRNNKNELQHKHKC